MLTAIPEVDLGIEYVIYALNVIHDLRNNIIDFDVTVIAVLD